MFNIVEIIIVWGRKWNSMSPYECTYKNNNKNHQQMPNECKFLQHPKAKTNISVTLWNTAVANFGFINLNAVILQIKIYLTPKIGKINILCLKQQQKEASETTSKGEMSVPSFQRGVGRRNRIAEIYVMQIQTYKSISQINQLNVFYLEYNVVT